MMDAPSTLATQVRRWSIAQAPLRLWVGLLLAGSWWAISWGALRPLSDFSFFPLWLGYVLTVDGLLAWRTGTSPMARSGWRVAWLFLLSAPFWWLFEAINLRLDNWQYELARPLSDLAYFFWAGLAFSTVIPAVLTTAELVRSFGIRSPGRLPAWNPSRRGLLLIAGLGALSLVAMLLWPRYLFPLCWLSLFLIFDPIGRLMGARTVSSYVAEGDWSPAINLALAGLICGWFWEMWNFYALPRWAYTVPFAEYLHVWEMPLLGYGGYIPFALEVYALYAIATRLTGKSVLPDMRIATRSN